MSDVKKELISRMEKPDIVDSAVLEVLDYAYATKRDIEIQIDQPEFTSVCPISGLPDFGRICIRYTPKEKIVEMKSLKYYLLQYRHVGIFYEHVVNCILEDLVGLLYPKSMEVIGTFTPRGGITTTVRVEYKREG